MDTVDVDFVQPNTGTIPKKVVVLIDWPNFRAKLRDNGLSFLPEELNRRLHLLGVPWTKEVFCDITQLEPKLQNEFRSEGFFLIHCPTISDPGRHVQGKETVDAIMIARMEQFGEIVDSWDIIVVATLDRDFQCALQRLRDKAGPRGKKVLILTPVADTPSMLAEHCDDVIAYISEERVDEIERKVLARAGSLFSSGIYLSTESDVQKCFEVLRIIVESLDEKLKINSGNFGFSALRQHLSRTPKLRPYRLPLKNIERFLEILRVQEVLLREEGKGDHCYRLDWGHSFIAFVRHLADKRSGAPEESAIATIVRTIGPDDIRRRSASNTGS